MTKAQVEYELVVYEELPPSAARGGFGKSVLNEQLELIAANDELWGKPVRIALYTKGTAATAAKNVLQQRNGRTPAVKGWKFYTRPIPVSDEPDADLQKGLFAIYTPDQIVAGALEQHEHAEKVRKEKLAEAREDRASDVEDNEDVDPDEFAGDDDEGDDDEENGD